MTRYPSYTHSGVDWIGQIPTDWTLKKLKYVFVEKKSTKNPYLNSGSISFGKVVYKDDEKILESTKESYQEVLDGEFLINPLNLNYDLKSLRIGKSRINVVVSQGYIVLKINDEFNPDYYEYFLRKFDVEQMKSLGNGVRQTISFTHIKDEMLVVPPLVNQEKISRYLDKKTEQIDLLIEKIQKKIELLKIQRASLINRCVTKGLDPNVEMKNSCVDWIGEIPKHWEVKKLKYFSSVELSSVDRHEYEDERRVSICHYPDVYNNESIDKNTNLPIGTCSENEFNKFLLREGDVLLTKDSESPDDIGIPTYVKEDLNNTVCGYHIAQIRTTTQEVLNFYLYKYIESSSVKDYFYMSSSGITRYGLGKGSIENLFVTVPPLKEQNEIISRLINHSHITNELTTKYQQRIRLLKEYRYSLISSLVTGKVKVTEEVL
jgi:type I restriction enzyme S subunit